MSNIKVTRTTVPKVFAPIKSQIDKVSKSRNTIIHRHSYLEKELRKLELLYSQELHVVDKNINRIRASRLKKYIEKKKTEFSDENQNLFNKTTSLFDILIVEYRKQKGKLYILTGRT